jgi:hypothetical protein
MSARASPSGARPPPPLRHEIFVDRHICAGNTDEAPTRPTWTWPSLAAQSVQQRKGLHTNSSGSGNSGGNTWSSYSRCHNKSPRPVSCALNRAMSDTDVSIELAGLRSIEGVDHVTNGAIDRVFLDTTSVVTCSLRNSQRIADGLR